MTVECPREHDVVAAVLSRRWPDGCDEELRVHAAECGICRDTVAVASLLHDDGQAARRDVQVPAAGQVWWRAAIRARVEAAHAMERPMTWVHGVAGACAVGVLVALVGAAWPGIEGAAASVSATLILSVLQRSLPVTLVAVACAILAPLAIYLATSDD